MHEKRFSGDIARLRSPARREMLEVERAVDLALDGMTLTSMLDVGTGSGLFAETFIRRGLEVCGIDANPEMVAAVNQILPGSCIHEAIAEFNSFPRQLL